MKSSRLLVSRRHRFAGVTAAFLVTSLFVMAGPADARVIGHRNAPAAAPSPADGATVSVSPPSLTFPTQRAGTSSGIGQTVTVTNTGSVAVVFTDILSSNDYVGSTTCFDHLSLAVSDSCTITVYFFPNKTGSRAGTLDIEDNADDSPQIVTLSGQGTTGFYLAGAHGEVGTFGDAGFHGDATAIGLKAPIISIKTTTNGAGYWLLASDGGIFSYGNAAFHGSTGAIHLNQPVVGMERTLDGKGYWLVARDGGIFSFGDAKFYGSTGAIHLNQPIVGMVARPDGKGYWMHASDGGIFAFGDAPFYGSSVGITNGTLVGMAATPDGGGYWLVSNTGSVHHYGNAPDLGDLPSVGVSASDVVGIAPTSPPLSLDFFP